VHVAKNNNILIGLRDLRYVLENGENFGGLDFRFKHFGGVNFVAPLLYHRFLIIICSLSSSSFFSRLIRCFDWEVDV